LIKEVKDSGLLKLSLLKAINWKENWCLRDCLATILNLKF